MQRIFWRRLGAGSALLALSLWSVSASMATAAASDADYSLGAQDKLRLKVFEWRPSRDEMFEWKALNDEYVVGAAGTLMLPLVGEVRAAGRSPSALAGAISDRLREVLSLVARPDVSVEVVEFRPFYILGQVERPGAYPYRPNLTVLQAVAIAGGLLRPKDLGLMRLERELITSDGELRVLGQERIGLIARRARLEAELKDASAIAFPAELTGERSVPTAGAVVKQEKMIFEARNDAFKTQTEALNQLKSHLEKEIVSLNAQSQMEDKQIGLVRRELQSISGLVEKGLVVAPRQLSLERTLVQIEGDKLRVGVSLMKAHQDLARTNIDLIELRNKRVNELTVELRETQSKIDGVASKIDTARQLLQEAEVTFPLAVRSSRIRVPPSFVLTRRVSGRSERITATEATSVEPGDTLDIDVPLPDAEPALASGGSDGVRRRGPGDARSAAALAP